MLGVPAALSAVAAAEVNRPFRVSASEYHACRHLKALLPNAGEGRSRWLESTMQGYQRGGLDCALWMAKNLGSYARRIGPECICLIISFIICSAMPASALGRLIQRPWQPSHSFAATCASAANWLGWVRFELTSGSRAIDPPWADAGSSYGIEIVPIHQAHEYIEEGELMRNCVASHYPSLVRHGHCRLFSLRRNGERVGTVEVRPAEDNPHVLTYGQIKSRANQPAHAQCHAAVQGWLAEINMRNSANASLPWMAANRPADVSHTREITFDLELYLSLTSVLRESEHTPLLALPLTPPDDFIRRLDRRITELARLARSRSRNARLN